MANDLRLRVLLTAIDKATAPLRSIQGQSVKAAQALKDHGATRVVAYCVHPVLSGSAIERINNSVIDELVVTDTIPLTPEAQLSPRIRQLSVADVLAETIRRISNEDSVSSLFIE